MPFKMLFGKKPDLFDLPEWGEKVWVLKEACGKLDAKADEGAMGWIQQRKQSSPNILAWKTTCDKQAQCLIQ